MIKGISPGTTNSQTRNFHVFCNFLFVPNVPRAFGGEKVAVILENEKMCPCGDWNLKPCHRSAGLHAFACLSLLGLFLNITLDGNPPVFVMFKGDMHRKSCRFECKNWAWLEFQRRWVRFSGLSSPNGGQRSAFCQVGWRREDLLFQYLNQRYSPPPPKKKKRNLTQNDDQCP